MAYRIYFQNEKRVLPFRPFYVFVVYRWILIRLGSPTHKLVTKALQKLCQRVVGVGRPGSKGGGLRGYRVGVIRWQSNR